MMGQLPTAQNALFYDFCLEHYIPQDHLLRQIDQVLDLTSFREHLSPYYSHTGRPSIDPELMMRMLIIGYCYGIRSERRLCEEIQLNLAYRWFCQLGLEDTIPDHSTFSKNRHGRFRESNAFRFVFPDEVDSTKTMINRVETLYGIKPHRLLGDTAYGVAPFLGWLVDEKQIEPHVPVWDKSDGKEGLFGRSDFTWKAEADHYVCPAGKLITHGHRNFKKPRKGITKDNTIIYRAKTSDCAACEYKQQCCPNTPHRKIARSIHEAARDVARALKETPEYAQSRKDRKKVEVLFGHMKNIHKFDRLRLRGIKGAQDEFLLVAMAQNLRRLAKLCYRPPPDDRIGVPA